LANEQILLAMKELSNGTRQIVDASNQVSTSAGAMRQLAETFQEFMNKFELERPAVNTMSNTRILDCRFCQGRNKIPLDSIFQSLHTAKCGRCHENLFLDETKPLLNLASKMYEHPSDTLTLESIKKIPGIDTILKTLLKESYERANRLYHKANTVAVTPRQLPCIYQCFLDAAFRLDLKPAPDLFVVQSPLPNSYTSGVEQPFVWSLLGCWSY